jgi:sialate O-acetylesterase
MKPHTPKRFSLRTHPSNDSGQNFSETGTTWHTLLKHIDTKDQKLKNILTALFIVLLASAAHAEVKPAGIFTHGAVLQQGEPVRIWGTAETGENVTVVFDDQKVLATADAQGHWMVTLDPMPVSSTPRELVFYGNDKKQVTLGDVLVGEVWLAGGQSNMAGVMRNYRRSYQSEIDQANDPLLRFLTIPRLEFEGQNDKRPQWEQTNPNNVNGFSASAYFFAKYLRQKLDVPIGIISCSVGATPAEAWVSRETLSSIPSLKRTLDAYDAHVEANFSDLDTYAELADEQSEKFKKWFQSRRNGTWDGEPRPEVPMGPHNYKRPAGLNETMLKQTIPYTIKGVIWYQGENNSSAGYQYRTVFPALIEAWRTYYQKPDLPFLFVQLATMGPAKDISAAWPELRDAQLWTADHVDNSGMIVLVDGGEVKNIHPHSKHLVGQRLSLLARNRVYGEKDLVCHGPRVDQVTRKEHHIELSFRNVGGGLVHKSFEQSPYEICGKDGKYVPAEAKVIDGKLIISAKGVEHPQHVRYGWRKWFEPTLFNKEGLPASPFKTDDFDYESKGRYYLDRL